ncbi:hypothetical protein AAVH_08057, partial [Aphelenchoides avenae]
MRNTVVWGLNNHQREVESGDTEGALQALAGYVIATRGPLRFDAGADLQAMFLDRVEHTATAFDQISLN